MARSGAIPCGVSQTCVQQARKAQRTDNSRCQTTRGSFAEFLMEPAKTADLDDQPRTPEAATQTSGGARRDRTDDLMLAKHALSQLSYGPMSKHAWNVRTERLKAMVGLGGLEPPTSRLSSARSNQLSYKPGTHGRLRPKPKAPRARSRRKRNEGGGFRKMAG